MARYILTLGILIFAIARALQRLVTEPLLETLDPLFVASTSLLVAALIMLPGICRAGGKNFWKFSLLLGTLNIALPALLFTLSQKYISASLAGVFVALVPVVVAIAAAFFLKEKLSWRGWFGIALASSSVIAAAIFSSAVSASLIGVGLSFFALLAIATAYILLRNQENWDLLAFVSAQALVAGLALLPLIDVSTISALALDQIVLLTILALSCVVVPQLVMVCLLRFSPAAKVAVANYLTPIITIILAVIFLGEGFSPVIITASLLAILGAWMVTRDRLANSS